MTGRARGLFHQEQPAWTANMTKVIHPASGNGPLPGFFKQKEAP